MPNYAEDNIVTLEEALEMKKYGKTHLTYSMPGKQTEFMLSEADITDYGGAVSGGKTRGLMLKPVKKLLTVPNYNAVIARETFPQLNNPGGLIQESKEVYEPLGATWHGQNKEWTFPGYGNKLRFIHVRDQKALDGLDGGQFSWLGIDESQNWDEPVVQGLWLRARGLSGERTELNMTSNPKKRSWKRKWLARYLDNRGMPIPEMCGVLSYFMGGEQGEKIWFKTEMDALIWWRFHFPDQYRMALDDPDMLVLPQSYTFIFSQATDNTVMMEGDPEYRSKLLSQPKALRKAKYDGCWDFDDEEGQYFRTEWLGEPLDWTLNEREYFDKNGKLMATIVRSCRGYDFAYKEKTEYNDPDWTVGCRLDVLDDGRILIADHKYNRNGWRGIETMIKENARLDPDITEISIPEDPVAGGGFSGGLIAKLAGLKISMTREGRSADPKIIDAKTYRFLPFSSQLQNKGTVRMLHDRNATPDWNDRLCAYLATTGTDEAKGKRDDGDALVRAFTYLFGTDEVNSDSLF